jgi:hypothetical protein
MWFLGLICDSLADIWDGFNRTHRGGLGESPRGLADFRRIRWIVASVLVLVGVAWMLFARV